MKDKRTYVCRDSHTDDSNKLHVSTEIDYDDHLFLSIDDGGLHVISVFLSPKQVKKLRKQLKKALKT